MNDKGTIVQQLEDELDHLRSQLQKIVEAGEPFMKYRKHLMGFRSYITAATGLDGTEDEYLTVGDFHRLAQALREVKHGKR